MRAMGYGDRTGSDVLAPGISERPMRPVWYIFGGAGWVGRQLEANAGATIMEGEGLIIIDRIAAHNRHLDDVTPCVIAVSGDRY
jgi:hypothetical protein